MQHLTTSTLPKELLKYVLDNINNEHIEIISEERDIVKNMITVCLEFSNGDMIVNKKMEYCINGVQIDKDILIVQDFSSWFQKSPNIQVLNGMFDLYGPKLSFKWQPQLLNIFNKIRDIVCLKLDVEYMQNIKTWTDVDITLYEFPGVSKIASRDMFETILGCTRLYNGHLIPLYYKTIDDIKIFYSIEKMYEYRSVKIKLPANLC